MFDEDANTSKERAEAGRKNMEFKDFYESVKLDIRDEANLGNNKSTYVVPSKWIDFVPDMIERLTSDSYTVKFNEGPRPKLEISWADEG